MILVVMKVFFDITFLYFLLFHINVMLLCFFKVKYLNLIWIIIIDIFVI